MEKGMNDWIRQEVAHGLEALLALRLKNAPAEDMIELTADIWVKAFSRRVNNEILDAPRIRAGFEQIFSRVREWPSPAEVIDKMPDRPTLPKLPEPRISDEQFALNMQRFDQIIKIASEGIQ